VEYDHHLSTDLCSDPDSTTYAFLQQRYGLTQSDELDFTRLLATVDVFPTVINWPHLEALVHRDE